LGIPLYDLTTNRENKAIKGLAKIKGFTITVPINELLKKIFFNGQGAPWEVKGHKGGPWWQNGVASF
jgi:hypothetical protein